ncbi:MAG: hypothetical protein ACK5TR_03665 [Alphaproteobacteria bacterium]|jgi:hypothetical protein|nr:hypothetical protein [Alphaproteobacteria bacterium]
MKIILNGLGTFLLSTTCLHASHHDQEKGLDDHKTVFFSTPSTVTVEATITEEKAQPRFAWILDYLKEVKEEFHALKDKASKQALVIRRLDEETLWEATSLQTLNRSALYLSETPTPLELMNSTHALALAIWAGDVSLVRAFLSVIDDVNAEILRIWGYRQWYTMGHLAADPQFFAPPLPGVKNEAWLEIMDLLAAKGANFQIVYNGLYANPALAAGAPSGRELPEGDARRARLLLHGADPTFVGSSFPPLYRKNGSEERNWRMKKVSELAVEQLKHLRKKGITVTPTTETKEQINKEIDHQISVLASIKLF